MQINGKRRRDWHFFSARASALVPRGFAARPSLVLSIYCHLKEEQGTARSLLSLVIASLVNGKGSHVIYTRESGKNMKGLC